MEDKSILSSPFYAVSSPLPSPPVRWLFTILGAAIVMAFSPPFVLAARQCRALVEISNDLFLVEETGATTVRFTNDGVQKLFPALAPDGSKVAFGLTGAPQQFRVVTASSQQGTFPAIDAADTAAAVSLVGVAWSTSAILGLEKHLGPRANRFEFYQIPADLSSSLRQLTRPSVGEVCILLPTGKRVACLQGDRVAVNNKTQFSNDGFTGATQLDTVTIPLGVSVSTQGTPQFQVQVKSLVDGVLLRVTPPTGVWTESRVAKGEVFALPLDDQVFGFSPTDIDIIAGRVTVSVLKSLFGLQVFDQVLAGNRTSLALVQRRGTQATLILMRGKKKLGEALLPIPESLSSLRFLTDTTLLFATAQRFGTFTVAPPQPGTSQLQLGPISELPHTLTVNLPNGPVSATVLDWSCTVP